MALGGRLARSGHGLHGFGRVCGGDGPPSRATLQLRQIAQDLVAHRVHRVRLVLGQLLLEERSSLLEGESKDEIWRKASPVALDLLVEPFGEHAVQGREVRVGPARVRRAAPAAPLVEQHDAVDPRVEQPAVPCRASGAGAAVQNDRRLPVRAAACLPVHEIAVAGGQHAVVVRFDFGVETRHGAPPSLPHWQAGRLSTIIRYPWRVGGIPSAPRVRSETS